MKINKRFQEYVDRINIWGRSNPITFPLSQENVDRLVANLSRDLSPENLTCDGELSRAQTKARYNKYTGIVKDLKTYCEKNGLVFNELSY